MTIGPACTRQALNSLQPSAQMVSSFQQFLRKAKKVSIMASGILSPGESCVHSALFMSLTKTLSSACISFLQSSWSKTFLGSFVTSVMRFFQSLPTISSTSYMMRQSGRMVMKTFKRGFFRLRFLFGFVQFYHILSIYCLLRKTRCIVTYSLHQAWPWFPNPPRMLLSPRNVVLAHLKPLFMTCTLSHQGQLHMWLFRCDSYSQCHCL